MLAKAKNVQSICKEEFAILVKDTEGWLHQIGFLILTCLREAFYHCLIYHLLLAVRLTWFLLVFSAYTGMMIFMEAVAKAKSMIFFFARGRF